MLIKKIYRNVFPNYVTELNRVFRAFPVESIVDIGCGDNSPIRDVAALQSVRKTGVDGFLPSITTARRLGTHDDYVVCDILDFVRNSSVKFDAVLLSDVVEHFKPPDAIEIIERCEKMAKKTLVVFTPNGFVEQGALYSNPWQVHQSGFKLNFFIERGFSVIGVGGLRPLRTGVYKPVVKPERLGELLCDFTVPFVRSTPNLCYSLLAYKILT